MQHAAAGEQQYVQLIPGRAVHIFVTRTVHVVQILLVIVVQQQILVGKGVLGTQIVQLYVMPWGRIVVPAVIVLSQPVGEVFPLVLVKDQGVQIIIMVPVVPK
jgi:hypothetical protein